MEKIKKVRYEEEFSRAYVSYAMSVISSRALPDVRDGLKPVQRRVIYASSQLTKSNTPHRKCARIVGDTMGKYHPHGDSSIYEALVNMAQDWKLNLPLIDPHGNFGAEDGSGAAAMRYTEARISEFTQDTALGDLKFIKDTFVPNFDETEKEPSALPFLVPNMLVSGTLGIAVGMATNIPPHNLAEVIDATTLYLEKDGEVSLDELLEVMPGPDFPTGGYINASKEMLYRAYQTGLEKIKVRGKVEIRDLGYGRKSICLTEIPYTMIGSTTKFMSTVADLLRSRQYPVLDKIDDIADRSSNTEICIAIDVKRGTTDEQIEEILNVLLKKSNLEDTYGLNMNCLNENHVAEVMSLPRILECFTKFKTEVYTKKYEQLLAEQKGILEVKQGLLEAVDCIDLIIEILRGSKNKADAKDCLMTGATAKIKFKYEGSEADARLLHFTEKQTDAILSMQLSQLIGLEVNALKKEISSVRKLIATYSGLLESPKLMKEKMIADMAEIKEKYGTPRKTVIQDFGEVSIKQADAIPEDVAVLIDRFFYVKVVDRALYDKNKEQIESEYRHVVLCQNLDRLAIFSDDNMVHVVKVAEIIKQIGKKNPKKVKMKLSDKGIQIFEMFDMSHDAELLYVDAVENITDKQMIMVFGNGRAKRLQGSVFDVSKKNTQSAKEDAHIVYVGLADDNEQLVAYTKNGMFIRTAIDGISFQGKTAAGVSLMKLEENDEIVYAAAGTPNSQFSSQGKDFPFTRIKLSNRDVKGIKLRL